MNKTEILSEIYSIPHWRQKIELEPRIYTPGSTVFPELWEKLRLPQNLKGQSFLDIGANDGLFSFLAEEKGAEKVVAVDLYSDNADSSSMTNGWSSKCIETVKLYKNSNIEIRSNSLYDFENSTEKFDVVFCANVIIWLNDPFKAHKILSSLTNSTLFIREDILLNHAPPMLGFSKLHEKFPEQGHLIGNKAYYEKTLKLFGFKSIEFLDIREDLIWNEYTRNHPVYSIETGVKIFNSFDSNESYFILSQSKEIRMSAQMNNRVYFRGLGWVEREDLNQQPLYTSSRVRIELKRLAQKLFNKKAEANYLIVARKN